MKIPLLDIPEESVYIDGRFFAFVTFIPIRAIVPLMAFSAITSLPRRLLKRLYAMIRPTLPGFTIKPKHFNNGSLEVTIKLYSGKYSNRFKYHVTKGGLIRTCNLRSLVSAFTFFQQFMEEVSSVDNEMTWEFIRRFNYITDVKPTRRYDDGVSYNIIYVTIEKTLILYISQGECQGEGFVLPPKARTGSVYCIHKVGLVV